jgi:hypothetical protein
MRQKISITYKHIEKVSRRDKISLPRHAHANVSLSSRIQQYSPLIAIREISVAVE